MSLFVSFLFVILCGGMPRAAEYSLMTRTLMLNNGPGPVADIMQTVKILVNNGIYNIDGFAGVKSEDIYNFSLISLPIIDFLKQLIASNSEALLILAGPAVPLLQ